MPENPSRKTRRKPYRKKRTKSDAKGEWDEASAELEVAISEKKFRAAFAMVVRKGSDSERTPAPVRMKSKRGSRMLFWG